MPGGRNFSRFIFFKRIAVGGKGEKRGGGRGIEINERLKKFTIRILLYFWFASKVQKNDDLGKKYRNKIVESVAECFNIVLLGL